MEAVRLILSPRPALPAPVSPLPPPKVTNQLEQPFDHIPTLDMADATLRAVER